ncbi:Hypothetical protein CINCED_3A021254 [Cinara cedri]|uniref:Uncharacterized protein n=1 Tax=Cinara cedri TaxID=506608 RepID=A0A5E4MQX4_9HEMI|nr:Hypothetical protein CINCED_3A021254 [Cinara cedri]
MKIEPICDDVIDPIEPVQPIEPPPLKIKLSKVAIPKLHKIKEVKEKIKKPRGRTGRRPRPILPMTQPIASTSTSHLEKASTPHQIIMPSPQMPGIAYQIFLGDHAKNSNNSVQYTMQPVFLQQPPTSAASSTPVVISQSAYQTRYQTKAQIPVTKMAKIAPKLSTRIYCAHCYNPVYNMNDHIQICELNPESKNYKFRKIAPSTPL